MYTFNRDIDNHSNYQAKSSEIPSNLKVLKVNEFRRPKQSRTKLPYGVPICNEERSQDDGASQTKDLKYFKSGGHAKESSDMVASPILLPDSSSPRSARD
jgi:hypothetical protein